MKNIKILLVLFTLFLVFVSLTIAALPAQPAVPLIGRTDWVIQGKAFQNVEPRLYEVRDSIRDSLQTVYWRTWSPQTQATKADLRTTPFMPAAYMAIPYGGFAGNPGIWVSLICQQNGKELAVATARTNNQMTEALVHVPSDWCSGDVVLDARSDSTSDYVEIGTPFKISWLDYQKSTFIGLIGILVVIFAAVWGLVFLPNLLFMPKNGKGKTIIGGVFIFGVISYALFFAYFFSHAAGIALSASIFAGEIILLAYLLVKRRAALYSTWTRWKAPTVLWGIGVLVSFCLASAIINGAGPWTVNALFTPVRWSTDNQIPTIVSEYLFHGLDPRTYDFGSWKISDRPPLIYGLMAGLRLVSSSIVSSHDGDSLFYEYGMISGIVINGLWIVALYYLLSALSLSRRSIYIIVLIIGLTPFAIFNSVYIWPKMLGAAFSIFAFIELFEPARNLGSNRFDRFGISLLWAAALSALALLSHGGTAFGIIAAIIMAVAYRGLPNWKLALGAIVAGFLILVPWGLWQHYIQPPGNALIKYAFAGTFGFGQESKSVLATIHDAYASLSLSDWLQIKLKALRVLVTGSGSIFGFPEMASVTSMPGQLRISDFLHFGPSLRFLSIGFLPLLLPWAWRHENNDVIDRIRFARIMVFTGLIGILLYAIVGFHGFINHMQSYESILEILTGLALVLYCARTWYFGLTLTLSMLYTIIVWVIDPIVQASRMEVLPVGVLIFTGVLITSIMLYEYFTTSSRPVANDNA